MKIVPQLPPNIAAIKDRFGFRVLNPGVVFTYGDVIFNPSKVVLPPWIVYHEQTHSEQQGSSPEEWWKRYLIDDTFRLDQELLAHQVEWAVFYKLHPSQRGLRQHTLSILAKRLSGPLYGHMIPFGEARRFIKRLTPRMERFINAAGAGRLSGREADESAREAPDREPHEDAGTAGLAG